MTLLNGMEVIEGLGVRLMTWCMTKTHHLSVIQLFELQGCNVARFVCQDLFQIAGSRGSPALHVGSFNENGMVKILVIVFPEHKELSNKTLRRAKLLFACTNVGPQWAYDELLSSRSLN